MGTGSLIFFGLVGLYLIGGPFVLLVIYVLLDRYSRKTPVLLIKGSKPKGELSPALWSFRDVKKIMDYEAKLQKGSRALCVLPVRRK